MAASDVGPAGRSMEIGHLQVGTAPGSHRFEGTEDSQAPAQCGRYGHVDAIAPPSRIREEAGITRIDEATGAEAVRLFTTAGATLGRAISHICNVVNPSGLVLYLPADLNVSRPAAASAYVEAVHAEIRSCFNAPDWAQEVRQLPRDDQELALLGAKAAATCVLQSFIEHALRLDDCQRDQQTVSMRKYMAKTRAGAVNVRHFDAPMTHAIEVDGQIWSFYDSREAAEAGAAQRRAQGHSAVVVEGQSLRANDPSTRVRSQMLRRIRAGRGSAFLLPHRWSRRSRSRNLGPANRVLACSPRQGRSGPRTVDTGIAANVVGRQDYAQGRAESTKAIAVSAVPMRGSAMAKSNEVVDYLRSEYKIAEVRCGTHAAVRSGWGPQPARPGHAGHRAE